MKPALSLYRDRDLVQILRIWRSCCMSAGLASDLGYTAHANTTLVFWLSSGSLALSCVWGQEGRSPMCVVVMEFRVGKIRDKRFQVAPQPFFVIHLRLSPIASMPYPAHSIGPELRGMLTRILVRCRTLSWLPWQGYSGDGRRANEVNCIASIGQSVTGYIEVVQIQPAHTSTEDC